MFFEPQFMKKVDIRSETIGSIRVLGYTGYKGLINWIYGIVMLKFGYSVNQFFFFFFFFNYNQFWIQSILCPFQFWV